MRSLRLRGVTNTRFVHTGDQANPYLQNPKPLVEDQCWLSCLRVMDLCHLGFGFSEHRLLK